jgi:hypothetical protein
MARLTAIGGGHDRELVAFERSLNREVPHGTIGEQERSEECVADS